MERESTAPVKHRQLHSEKQAGKKFPQPKFIIESMVRISHIADAQSRTCLWASTASPKSEISGQVQTAKSRWRFRSRNRGCLEATTVRAFSVSS
jgi:hypothetical protein